jgi:site-specific recombinase XerD
MAPLRPLRSAGALFRIVDMAIERAGLDPPHRGPYLLRHSLATNMLRRGASLRAIGEILRHQRPDTTTRYAKVDLDSLRALALPWPESIGVAT